jgi:transposase-like protein
MSLDLGTELSMLDREKGYRDEDVLRELYWSEGLTQGEIADVFDTHQAVISEWMRRHDVQTRSKRRGPTHLRINDGGYECWEVGSLGKQVSVPVHRLLMIAEHGFEAVTEADVVHHRNGIPWDNRPENLELMGNAEHTKHHVDIEFSGAPWRDEDILYQKYVKEGKTFAEVADELGADGPTVSMWLRKYGLLEEGKHEVRPWRDEDVLHKEYVEKGKSTVEVANELGASAGTISRWLDNYNIPVRSRGDVQDEPWHDEDILYQEYIEEGKTIEEVADALGASESTIGRYLHKHDIPVRNRWERV